MHKHPEDTNVTENGCSALFYYPEYMLNLDIVVLQEPATTFFSSAIKVLLASLGREKDAQKYEADIRGMMASQAHRTNVQVTLTAGGVPVLQSVLLRHQAPPKVVYVAYKLLSIISAFYPLQLEVSSDMFEKLRRGIMDGNVCGSIMQTIVNITNTPALEIAEDDAAQIRVRMKNNITALFPGLCWILAATQLHMRTKPLLLLSLKLLTNMAENAASNDMAGCIIESLGFSVVLDGMNCFRPDYGVQCQGAKATWALHRFGGVETIDENAKQRALQMLNIAETLFVSADQREIGTVAKNARVLMQPEPIMLDE